MSDAQFFIVCSDDGNVARSESRRTFEGRDRLGRFPDTVLGAPQLAQNNRVVGVESIRGLVLGGRLRKTTLHAQDLGLRAQDLALDSVCVGIVYIVNMEGEDLGGQVVGAP